MAWKRKMRSRAVDGPHAASLCVIAALLGARLRPSGIAAGCQIERNYGISCTKKRKRNGHRHWIYHLHLDFHLAHDLEKKSVRSCVYISVSCLWFSFDLPLLCCRAVFAHFDHLLPGNGPGAHPHWQSRLGKNMSSCVSDVGSTDSLQQVRPRIREYRKLRFKDFTHSHCRKLLLSTPWYPS